MTKYLSNRQKSLKVGIESYTNNDLVLEVIGNTNILGFATVSNITVTDNANFTNVNIGIGTTTNSQYKFTVNAGIADTSVWILTYGDTGIGITDQHHSGVAYDSQGNIYASGSNNFYEIFFVVKYDTYGSIIWQKFFEHIDQDRVYQSCEGIAVDKSDDSVYVSVIDDTIKSSTLVKLNSSGNILWQKEIYDEGTQSYFYAIGIGNTGDVYLLGEISSEGSGTNDAFLIKFNSSGTEQWQKVIGGIALDSGYGIAIDSDDNVYVVGSTNSEGSIDDYDAFLIKFNSSGTEQWQKVIGGVDDDSGYGIAIDSDDNIYIVGSTNYEGSVTSDAFLIKFNSSGTEQWQKVIGGVDDDSGYGIAIDSDDNVYITGNSESGIGIYIASFDSSGSLLNQKQLYSNIGEYQWYNYGHDLIDIRNDKLVIGGYTYNAAPAYSAEGLLVQLPTSLDTTRHFGSNFDFTFRDSDFTVGVSTLTVGVSTLTVSVSEVGVTTAGLTTETSPLTFYRTFYTSAPVSINASGESNFETLNVGNIFVGNLVINDLPLGKSSLFLSNFIVGYTAGNSITSGSNNNFLGSGSGGSNTTGNNNNFFGSSAGYLNTTGIRNNFLGQNAGYWNTTGSYNNFLGHNAGLGQYSTGSYNIFLGSNTGISTSASNKIIIGNSYNFSSPFDSPNTTKDTQFAVGIRTDTNSSKYWLVGNENFNIGIATTNPTSKLTVGGDGLFVGIVTATSYRGDGSQLTGISAGTDITSCLFT